MPPHLRRYIICLLGASCLPGFCHGKEPAQLDAKFEAEVAPLLIKRCIECHAKPSPSGNLLLTTQEGLLKGGVSGNVIDHDHPADSYLLTRIHSGDMPPEKQGNPQPLPDKEVKIIERWIASGAYWPQGRVLDLFEQTTELRAGRDWWSLQPIQRPEIPSTTSAKQHANPIDAFVYSKLTQRGMTPAPPADKSVLIRRLYFDLIGIPPTFAEIKRFENDQADNAWGKLVEELLASPKYGERWGRYWLDLARYADTSGYERDQEKPFAWKYRDWVVNALNSDMPYDQFAMEQLAGDEVPNRTAESVIATGFLRLGTWNDEPNDPLDYQYERLEDLVHATSTAFLGMTVKCARCHSHKFDPITQEDYYRMASTFWAGPIESRDRALLGGPSTEELGVSDILGWTDLSSSPKPLHLLKNGERKHPLQVVRPASLSMLPELERSFDPPPANAKTSTRRLQLAKWITDQNNPLPPRVLVNRLWLHHFGEGIVRSPNNFGFLSEPPTHPLLLDWLASELIDSGWSIKHVHRLILNSKTWKQSSIHPESSSYQDKDANNLLWWRANRRRLDAEALRDSMLAVSGELDSRLGGPGFQPTISQDALVGLSRKSAAWKASPVSEQNRRSLYMFTKRGLLPPMMTTFDFCDATQPCGQRDISTLPTQALTLMNNRFVHDRSEALASRIAAQVDNRHGQIHALWNKIYSREPTECEIKIALEFLSRQRPRFRDSLKLLADASLRQINQTQSLIQDTLVLHLRANKGITLDDLGRVTSWKDVSKHNHDAFQIDPESRPTVNKNAFNGHPVVTFDGQRRFLKINGKLLNKQACTLIAVVNDRGKPGHREIISNWDGSSGNSGTSLFLGLTSEQTIRFTDAIPNAGSIPDRDQPFMITAINGIDHSAVYVNGISTFDKSAPLPQRNLKTDWVIGQQGNIDGEYWHGAIAELRVYSRSLSVQERSIIEQELAKRYAIPIQSPDKSNRNKQLSADEFALASLAHVLLNSNEFLYVD